MDKKIIIKNRGAITRNTIEYKELAETIRYAVQTSNKLIAKVESPMLDERYMTTAQVMPHPHISRRTLQNPYTPIRRNARLS